MTERGCVKEDRCDFLHPLAPNGETTRRVCDYFGTRRGCAKEKRCNFLHLNCVKKNPQQQPVAATASAYGAPPSAYGEYPGYGAPPSNGGQPGMRPAMQTTAQTTGNTRVCSFYQEPRGCAKQERCDFIHQGPSSHAPATPLLATPGADPNMAAYDPAYAAYYQMYAAQAAQGGHPGAAGQMAAGQQYSYPPSPYGAYDPNAYAQHAPVQAAPPAAASSGRVCSFFGTQRGCRKGDRCDFVHPAGGVADAAAKPSVRYSPY